MKNSKDPNHLSYLLRLWRSERPLNSEWRASLESSETGQRIGFANLEQLFAYLMDLSEGTDNMRQKTEKKGVDDPGNKN